MKPAFNAASRRNPIRKVHYEDTTRFSKHPKLDTIGESFLKASLLLAVTGLAAGCYFRDQQYELESRSIYGIVRMLRAYDIEHPNVRVTNLSQLVRQDKGYPYQWHHDFARFGKHAGFNNSIYEKYIFFPPGMTSSWMEGEILLMNAKPYPEPNGTFQRRIVAKAGNEFRTGNVDEGRVQQWFKDQGISEPKPPVMPPPPPAPPGAVYQEPWSKTVSRFFEYLARNIGMRRVTGENLQRGTYIAIPSIAFLVLLWLAVMRVRRSRR